MMTFESDPKVRIIGVIDIRNGRAVHARGGRRADYAPVGAAAGEQSTAIRPDWPVSNRCARGRELYVADLDAIERGGSEDDERGVIVDRRRSACRCGWTRAREATAAGKAGELGATTVVVGLETLPTFDALGAMSRRSAVRASRSASISVRAYRRRCRTGERPSVTDVRCGPRPPESAP